MNITGYRTNEDNTETLAWTEAADGSVTCDHDTKRACDACVDNDSRLRRVNGSKVVVRQWPSNAIRDGRTVRYVSLAG